MTSKTLFKKYGLLGVVVAGGLFWLFNGATMSTARGCSADLARPCYESVALNNLNATVGDSKKQKLNKEDGPKEFLSCINSPVSRRGIAKERTKVCDGEVVQYCEGKWNSNKNNDKDNDKKQKIKKYEGECDNTPPPPVVPPVPKTLSYSVTKLPMPTLPIVHARRTIGGAWQDPDEVLRIRVSAAATNEQPVTITFNAVATEIPVMINSPDDISCADFYMGGVLRPATVSNLSMNGMPAQGDVPIYALYGSSALGRCQFGPIWQSEPIVPGTYKDYTFAIDNMAIPTANPKTFFLDVYPFPVGPIGYVFENSAVPYANPANPVSFTSDSIQIVLP